MPEPTNMLEFQNQFGSDDACLDYLERLRWPNGFICPNCDHDFGYRIAYRRLIQCAVCRHQTSVTAGTLFHKTRIPLLKWFYMIYLTTSDKGGASAMRLSKQLGMHYATVWFCLHKIRSALARRDDAITLAGFIELDEAVIGPHARKTGRQRSKKDDNDHKKGPRLKSLGRKPKTGKKTKTQTEVLVMVERENHSAGNIAMKVITKTTRDDLREAAGLRVDDNRQFFKTDACQSHYVLKSMGHDLLAQCLSNSPLSVEELPIVHRAIALVKRLLMGTYHGVSSRFLQPYLDEFCFRWNRRDHESTLWQSALRACALALPTQHAELRL
jgi:hypothetical protein